VIVRKRGRACSHAGDDQDQNAVQMHESPSLIRNMVRPRIGQEVPCAADGKIVKVINPFGFCALRSTPYASDSAAEAADWFAHNGPMLRSVSSRLQTTPVPPQLLHCDVRSDNLRWKNGRLYLVDWAEAVAGPPEFDAAFFIQSIVVESPLDPETILAWYREVNPLDPKIMEAAVCVAAAFFADRAWLPELPGLPRLRTFQRKQLVVTLRWALRRLGVETPRWLTAIAGGLAE